MTKKFLKETDLCAAFIKQVPKEWTVYAETGGFDILLVRKEDGFQIGIEAKLKLNGKVICQVAEPLSTFSALYSGTDCRAVLVPSDASGELEGVCSLLGIEVIRMPHPDGDNYGNVRFRPDLPTINDGKYWCQANWFEFCPQKRIELPDYVPDTIAGDKSPVTLTVWKIAAMKLAILLDKTGFLTRQDFKDLTVSMPRWTTYWIMPSTIKGQWVKGERFPDFARQHPINYKEIEADFDTWNPRKKEGMLV